VKPLSLLAAFLLSSGIFAQQAPKWYNTGKLEGYDSKLYLLGFGVGSDFSEASAKAQEQIAAQIKNEIKSEVNIIEEEISLNNSSLTKSDISQSITINVNRSIAGATVLVREVVNGKHYTASGLSKAFFISSLEFKSLELQQALEILYDQAKNGLLEGRLDYFYKNKPIFEKTFVELSAAEGLLRSFGNPSFSTFDKDFAMLIDNIKSIDLSVISGQKQAVVIGFPFKEIVSVRATMNYAGNEVPIVNIPIRTVGIEPKEIKAWTDAKGVAAFRLPATFKEDKPKSINFELLKSHFSRKGKNLPEVKSPRLRFTTVKTLPLIFEIDIVDESSRSKKAVSDVKKKITKTITSLGHSIAQNDKLLLRNTISVENPLEVDGKDGTMYLVTGELYVELVSLQNQKVLAVTTSKSKGLHKDSPEKALEKAVKSMKLSKKNFGKILDEAESEIIALMQEFSKNSLEEGKANYKLRKFDKAMENLLNVNFGEEMIVESKELMDEIQATLQKEEEERIQRELEEMEKDRQLKLEQERIKAQAKIQAQKLEADRAWAKMKEAEFKKQSEELKLEIVNSIQNNTNPLINDIKLDTPFNKLSSFDQIILFMQPGINNQSLDILLSDSSLVGSWELKTALKNDGSIFETGKDSEFLVFRTDGTFNGFGLNSSWSSIVNSEKINLGDKEIKFKKENLMIYFTFRISNSLYTLAYSKIED